MIDLWSRWMQPKSSVCPICGSQVNEVPAYAAAYIPVRHPAPRAILATLCVGCREAIPWITIAVCRICGRPEGCEDCQRLDIRYYEVSRSAVKYNSAMKELLALYKYRGSEGLERVMAAMLAFSYEHLQRDLGKQGREIFHPVVTSVPLARERLEERGFNQAERMAIRIAGWYGLTYAPLLVRQFHTEKQSLKNRRSRTTDMRGIFTLSTAKTEVQSTVLLVDDIYTTGSTLNECARILRSGSVSHASPSVYGILWARS